MLQLAFGITNIGANAPDWPTLPSDSVNRYVLGSSYQHLVIVWTRVHSSGGGDTRVAGEGKRPMQPSTHTAGTNTKRRTKRSNMVDRGMVSLLAAVEVASSHSPTASDRQPPMATTPRAADEPRKGARVFSVEERASLEAEYAQNKFPTRAMMVEFAGQLGKPPEKVRTWFNNRRALDRKMGVTVVRQPTARPSPPELSPSPEPASMPSPPVSSEDVKPNINPNMGEHANPLLLPAAGGSMLTPDASRWPSKLTPIAASRRLSVVTPMAPSSTPRRTPSSFVRSHSQAPSSSSRPRLNPTRLRKVRLRLGNTELHGEGHPEEVGLEVKFLYGKKRLVYEWYCGKNYSEAAVTGGPYAKIEINFDSLFSMAFERTRDGSVIRMVLSDSPTLYRQTEHNMHKFKVRTQQRQYQKAGPGQFNEDVFAKDHQILLRSDEAARVKKTILESVPELATLIQPNAGLVPALSDAHGSQNDRVTDTDSMSAGARTELVTPAVINKTEDLAVGRTSNDVDDLNTPRLAKLPSEPTSGKSDAPAPAPADESEALNPQGNPDMEVEKVISSKPINSARRTPMGVPSRAHVWETPTRSNVRRAVLSANDQGAGSSSLITRSGGNAAFLFPAPAPWQSPATPFGSEVNTVRGPNVNFWLSGGPPSVGATPLVATSGSLNTPTPGPLVRRALDFTPGDFRAGRITVTPTQGRKRRFFEINDENDPAVLNKQARQTLSTPVSKISAFPPPPMPPPLPPPPPPPLPSPMQRANKVKEETMKPNPSGNPSGEGKGVPLASAAPAADNEKGALALPR